MMYPLPIDRLLGNVSRTAVRCAAAGLALVVLADVAAAQKARVQTASAEWEQRFDSAPAAARMPKTTVPIISVPTLQSTEAALQQYIQIESAGGTLTLTTVAGQPLTAGLENGAITLTDANGTKAYVTTYDVNQANGVFHVVNGVLVPKLG